MNDEEKKFKNLLLKDPNPGTKERMVRKDNIFKIPGWVFDCPEKEVEITQKRLNRKLSQAGYSGQIGYDILQLGITDIKDRPKCPICGEVAKFRRICEGYKLTCGKDSCIKEKTKRTVTNLWNEDSYRNQQTESHVKWSSIKENREKLSIATLNVWKRDGYREKQSKLHIEFAKNNPDKISNGNSSIKGNIESKKSIKSRLRFDSSWEKDFIVFCNKTDEIISIERTMINIPYKFKEEEHLYFPDFDIILSNNLKLLVEIKPDWKIKLDEKTRLKIQAGKEFVKNSKIYFDYLLLTNDDLYFPPSYTKFNEKAIKNEITKYININN